MDRPQARIEPTTIGPVTSQPRNPAGRLGRITSSNQTAAVAMLASASGTSVFQAKSISRSTRSRGTVARIQKITKT